MIRENDKKLKRINGGACAVSVLHVIINKT
jgi:hypothetical protein